jgi:hypothetical protein
MTYEVTTTTKVATAHGLQNVVATLCHNGTKTRLVFKTYDDASAFAQGYAIATGMAYVKPATQAPTLKENESYVEVVAA